MPSSVSFQYKGYVSIICSCVSGGMCILHTQEVHVTDLLGSRVLKQLVAVRAMGFTFPKEQRWRVGPGEVCRGGESSKCCWGPFGLREPRSRSVSQEAPAAELRHAYRGAYTRPHHLLISGIEITRSCWTHNLSSLMNVQLWQMCWHL